MSNYVWCVVFGACSLSLALVARRLVFGDDGKR